MPSTTELRDAFAYHRGVVSAPIRAADALAQAHTDAAAGRKRYGAPEAGYLSRQDDGKAHASKPECFGLRHVGDVVAESYGGRDCWNTRNERGGWYTDPHGDVFKDGSGLCWGVVYQLPGRDGKARFVAGYEFGWCDGGPTLNLSTIYESEPGEAGAYDTSPRDLKAAREAARRADDIAKRAAEEEKAYQAAWAAGNQWRELGDECDDERAHALALLQERRAVKGASGYPAICTAIRETVRGKLATIRRNRVKRAKLASGDVEPLYFWPGDKVARAAFNDGAGREVLT